MIDKITRKRKVQTAGSLPLGQLFFYGDDLYMKISTMSQEDISAVNMTNGHRLHYRKDTNVEPVRGYIQINTE